MNYYRIFSNCNLNEIIVDDNGLNAIENILSKEEFKKLEIQTLNKSNLSRGDFDYFFIATWRITKNGFGAGVNFKLDNDGERNIFYDINGNEYHN